MVPVGMTCTLCNVHLTAPEQINQHFSGKKHMKRQYQEYNKEKQEGKTVYVTRLKELNISSVQIYMAQFGTVVNILVGWDRNFKDRLHHLIVEFESKESVTQILSRDMRSKHNIQIPDTSPPRFQQIHVEERSFKPRPRSPSPPACPGVNLNEIKLKLSLNFDPEDQIQEIVSLTQLNQEDIEERSDICENIRKTFSRNGYPGCILLPFGSTVNGLGFRGCDLDVYLDLGDIPWGPSPSNPLISVPVTLTEVQKVRLAARLLRQIPQCCKIVPITSARVPIVKFVHKISGINCDISFKSRASSLNSEYIRFCSEFDSRVRPLMMTIRLFCKTYDLSGGGGGMRISNYALTMLVIFYLQQLHQPLLHTVHQLQQHIEGSPEMISGWNCSFSSNPSKLPSLAVNKQGLLELLHGFFSLYSCIDFSSNLISPYLGRLVTRHTLQTNIPQEFSGYQDFLGERENSLVIDKPICLQDPFELNVNTCKGLPVKAVSILQCFFKAATSVCQDLISTSTHSPGGLNRLFELKVTLPKEKTISDLEALFNQLPGVKVFCAVQLPCNTGEEMKPNLEDKDDTSLIETKPDNDIPESNLNPVIDPLHQVQDVLFTIFKTVLKFEMINSKLGTGKVETNNASEDVADDDIIINDAEARQTNDKMHTEDQIIDTKDRSEEINTVDKQQDENTDEASNSKRKSNIDLKSKDGKKRRQDTFTAKHFISQDWKLTAPVWISRKKVSDSIPTQNSELQRETLITDRILKELNMKEYPEAEITFRTYLAIIQGSPCIGLQVISSRKKTYESFFLWLRSHLPDLYKRISKDKRINQIQA